MYYNMDNNRINYGGAFMKGYGLIFLLISVILLTGCHIHIGSDDNGWVSNTKEYNESIEIDGVKFVNLKIDMGVGKLYVKGNSDKLADCNFIYNIESWKPRVKYEKNGESGDLSIKQPSSSNVSINNAKYEWNIKLNENILYDIEAKIGVAENTLDLSEIGLKSLSLKLGIGKSTVDISGKYENDVDVVIEGGIGETTIYVPMGMNTEIDSEAGIGKVDIQGGNPSNTDSKYIMRIKVKSGIGKISIKRR